MAGVDQLHMDLSLSSLVIAIAPLYLMILHVPPRRLGAQSLVPLDNIGTQLVSCQGDQLVPLP